MKTPTVDEHLYNTHTIRDITEAKIQSSLRSPCSIVDSRLDGSAAIQSENEIPYNITQNNANKTNRGTKWGQVDYASPKSSFDKFDNSNKKDCSGCSQQPFNHDCMNSHIELNKEDVTQGFTDSEVLNSAAKQCDCTQPLKNILKPENSLPGSSKNKQAIKDKRPCTLQW